LLSDLLPQRESLQCHRSTTNTPITLRQIAKLYDQWHDADNFGGFFGFMESEV